MGSLSHILKRMSHWEQEHFASLPCIIASWLHAKLFYNINFKGMVIEKMGKRGEINILSLKKNNIFLENIHKTAQENERKTGCHQEGYILVHREGVSTP